jgi:hypothetical protein
VARRSFNPVILDLERHALWGRRSRERAPGSTASNSAAYVDALRDGTRVAWNRWINTHVPDVHQRLTENGHETQMAPVLCSCSFCAGTCDRDGAGSATASSATWGISIRPRTLGQERGRAAPGSLHPDTDKPFLAVRRLSHQVTGCADR